MGPCQRLFQEIRFRRLGQLRAPLRHSGPKREGYRPRHRQPDTTCISTPSLSTAMPASSSSAMTNTGPGRCATPSMPCRGGRPRRALRRQFHVADPARRTRAARQICYKYRARAEDPHARAQRRPRVTNSWEAPEIGRPGALTFGLNGTARHLCRLVAAAPRAAPAASRLPAGALGASKAPAPTMATCSAAQAHLRLRGRRPDLCHPRRPALGDPRGRGAGGHRDHRPGAGDHRRMGLGQLCGRGLHRLRRCPRGGRGAVWRRDARCHRQGIARLRHDRRYRPRARARSLTPAVANGCAASKQAIRRSNASPAMSSNASGRVKVEAGQRVARMERSAIRDPPAQETKTRIAFCCIRATLVHAAMDLVSRCMKTSQAASWATSTYSSGLWAWSMEPGPHTTVG